MLEPELVAKGIIRRIVPTIMIRRKLATITRAGLSSIHSTIFLVLLLRTSIYCTIAFQICSISFFAQTIMIWFPACMTVSPTGVMVSPSSPAITTTRAP